MAAASREGRRRLLALQPGRIVALVGESGSGKTTLARLLRRFYPPTSGEIRLHGETRAQGKPRVRDYCDVQMIFQDPFGSLNPVQRSAYNLQRPLKLHHAVRDERPTSSGGGGAAASGSV